MKKWKDKKKENKLGLIVLILSIIICIISVAYAFWKNSFIGQKENELTTATLSLDLTEENSGITLLNAVPATDSRGLAYEPYKFKVINNSSYNSASYTLSLEDDIASYISEGCQDMRLDWNDIKYAISEDGSAPKIDLLSSENGLMYTTTIKPKQIKSYVVHLWIKSEATREIMNKCFYGKVKLEAIIINS